MFNRKQAIFKGFEGMYCVMHYGFLCYIWTAYGNPQEGWLPLKQELLGNSVYDLEVGRHRI